MEKSTLLHPHFFRTLVTGFDTHLTIPLDFFSKYVKGGNLENKTTAELKSDSSDMTWKVKMTGRRLSDGWREFAVANNLQVGEVVLVRYEGEMVFRVSNLGSSYCEIQDIPPPRNNLYGQDDIGRTLLKKRLYPRTQVDFSSNDDDEEDGDDDEEFQRKKKVRKNNPEAEAVSTSTSDKSCFVALVTASSRRTDKLYLPQHVTSSNGFSRKSRKIVLINGGERSWTLDLSFNKSSESFYMSRGWRNFCDENGQEAGGFFMFKLVGNGETPVLNFSPTQSHGDRNQRDCSETSEGESLSTESPVLSFCSTESIDIRRQKDRSETSMRESLSTELTSEEENTEGESSEDGCSSVDSLMEIGKKKCSQKRRTFSYSPCHKRFVTFTLPPDYITLLHLSLPKPFVKENGINKPGEISLLGKDGTKWPTSLLLNKRGIMSLGKGWKEFVKANGLESGFTLKLIWEDTTPVFSLCWPESTSDREQEEYFKTIKKQSLFIDPRKRDKISKDENNKEESRSWERKTKERYSTPLSHNQFVILTITPDSFRKCRLRLPRKFTRDNDINKLRMITLLGGDGTMHQTTLKFDTRGQDMALGSGWKVFAEANDLKLGDSFTLKLIWEGSTPVLSLCPLECSIDRGGRRGGCFETNQKKSLPIEPNCCGKSSKDEKINDDNSKEKNNREENSKDSTPSSQKQFVRLTITPSSFSKRILILPAQFARENSMNKPGMVIYMVGKDGRKWMTTIKRVNRKTVGLGKEWKGFAEANNFKSGDSFTMELIWEDGTRMLRLFHTESSSSKANEKESVSTEPRSRDSSSAVQNRFVTLTLTLEDVRACMLILPSQFMKDNGINKLGKITILGENKMECSAYLLSRNGTVALEDCWDEFCEANGVKLGESFTLEFINEQDKPTPVFKFCSWVTNKK